MESGTIWIYIGTLALAFTSLLSIIFQLRSDVTHIKVTLDKIAKHIGLADTVTENIDAELKSLISEGKKIKAIKRYRMVTGLGLKEAKEYVDLFSEQELK
ncbi:MAG: ribosomal protein L7/L12 [Clostridium sp.]|uniref:ribosomal protein L7/L12 n=1 Tax=Clostridium sp. TaxID=1506 RepID=UPI003D6CE1B9